MAPVSNQAKLYVYYQNNVSEIMLSGYQTFGRPSSSTNPGIAVNSSVVSRNHGEFNTDSYGTYYRELGSANGTFYNNTLVTPGTNILLQNGDVLRIHCASDSACNMDVLLIYADTYEPCEWKTLSLSGASQINIGRNEALRLNNPEVSRRHAVFYCGTRGWSVIDQGSTNGVYKNGMHVSEQVLLTKCDVVRIACYNFIFLGDHILYQCDATNASSSDMGHHNSLLWSDRSVPLFNSGSGIGNVYGYPNPLGPVGYDPGVAPVRDANIPAPVKRPVIAGSGLSINIAERSVTKRGKKKMLLKDVRMNIPSGSMVLILGGSGAGKTTFMNAVMGYEQADGQILYNGTDIYAEFERMQYEIGYVPQQDLMRMNDIALETVTNAAQLKLPTGQPDSYYIAQAERAMNTLGLADEKQQMVRSLSGGQRKRLSIAMEYVGNPSLFFLDEPDSGVDNTNSELLLNNLRTISNEGKIVMFISHSPDRTIELIDKIIILAKDSANDCGRLVFYGEPHAALRFFDVENLNKIVSRINKKNEGGEGLADYYIEKFQREAHLYG